MDLTTAKANAAIALKNVCRVCKYCDGVACAGQVPGYGGVGSGSSFINNVKALAKLTINMRVLHESFEPDIKKSLLGIELSMPIIGAAVAGVRINKMGELNEGEMADSMILGARLAGTIGMGGDGGDTEVYEATLGSIKRANGIAIPVIKPRMNDEILKRVMLAKDAGASVVAIDVDAAGLVNMALTGQKVEPKTSGKIEEIVNKASGMKIILKGIMTKEDAIIALEAGAAGIVVSNHGGRALDCTPGTAEVLPAIAEAVAKRMIVLADGGIRTGIDVLKMLALGADAVLIGRPLAIAAAGGGAEAVKLQYDEYASLLKRAMILTGCATLAHITPSVIYRP